MAQTELRQFLLFLFHRTEFRLFSVSLRIRNVIREVPSIFSHGTDFWVVFSSAEGFGTEFWEISVLQNSRNCVENTHLFRLFHLLWNYVLSEIHNPSSEPSRYPSGELQTVFGMAAYTLSAETIKFFLVRCHININILTLSRSGRVWIDFSLFNPNKRKM